MAGVAPTPVINTMRRRVLARHLPMLLRFRRRMGYWPDPVWPRTHNERMLWRKIFDHNPEFVTLTDKLAAKAVVAERNPGLRQPRVLWSGADPATIPDTVLAGGAILKANNGSGSNQVVRDGAPERAVVERRIRAWLRRGRRREEWAYWRVSPQALAEELLPLGGKGLPTDIKVHVFAGLVAHAWAVDKRTGASVIVDNEGQPTDAMSISDTLRLAWSARIGELAREAIRLAPGLAGQLDYIRVDFLVTADGLWAGELTVYPAAGFDSWTRPLMAARVQDMWDIRNSHFVRTGSGPYVEALRADWRP